MTPDKRVEKIVEKIVEEFVENYYSEGSEGGIVFSTGFNGQLIEDWLTTTLTQHHQDMMSEAVEAERKEWLSGNRCGLCGGNNLDSKGLSDVCGKCFEEQ